MNRIVLCSLVFALPLFASADMPSVTKCIGTLNSGLKAEFRMVSTMVPTFFNAQLAIEDLGRTVGMNCKVFAGDISAEECVEKNVEINKYKVTLSQGKAFVSQEGSNPGQNDIELGTLVCK